jgi:hypothetical protein
MRIEDGLPASALERAQLIVRREGLREKCQSECEQQQVTLHGAPSIGMMW